MKLRSLRLRLLAGGAVAIFLALALAGSGISWLIHKHIERREAAQLQSVAERLVAGLTFDSAGAPVIDVAPGEAEFQSIASGTYWQVATPAGTAQSPSLWDQSLPMASATGNSWSVATVSGPFDKQLMMVSRLIRPESGGAEATVRVAGDDAKMRDALREFDAELALSLALLWLVLTAAAFVQVGLGLRPLDRLRLDLDRLRRSPSARLSSEHPGEIVPLIDAINAMAEAREKDLTRARRRAADLAHSLKTPLAVVAAQSRKAREAGADDAADGIDRAVDAAGAALEAELARSRAAAARSAAGQCMPALIVEKLLAVVERTEKGETIVFSNDVEPELTIDVDESHLAEMLGALIENAARHARRMVSISSRETEGAITLAVEDDGPGMDEQARERATRRGVRIDESDSGHGFGLAIVHDLVEATEGRLRLDRSARGGLAAELIWPAAGHDQKLR